MPFSVAISGKGGTGKTTVTGLILKGLLLGGRKPILVIDADHDGNLAEVLGIEGVRTVGEVVEELQQRASTLPPDLSKEQWLSSRLQEVMVEERGFDFLSMGRGEGPGCYCFVNSVLRKIMDAISDDYPYVLMDNAAGMEHLSRRTTRDADLLLLVSDHSLKGLKSALRIAELAEELELKIGRVGLIINRAPGRADERLLEVAKGGGLEVLGVVPEDEEIARYDLEGKSLLELSEDNPAFKAVGEVLEKVLTQ